MRPMMAMVCLTLLAAPAARAQQQAGDPAANRSLFVFLDCNAPYCDFDHTRREITWVNWVRDRKDADVHLLVTAQITGGGGWDFDLDYIGLDGFSGQGDTLSYISDPDDVDAEVREGLTRTVALGLVRFAARTAIASNLRVTFDSPAAAQVAPLAQQEDDPWNLWVFRVGFNGSIDGEATQRSYSVRGNASANRTSENFKINIFTSGRRRVRAFDLDDSTTVENITENYNANVLAVWSLGERTSLGFVTSASRSTFNNQDLVLSGGPSFEFNIYPYDESTRRSITLRYSFEIAAFDYELPTVTGRTSEVRPRHSLEIAANIQQPWGSIFGSIVGLGYLHDLTVHRIDTFTGLQLRVVRGLSFNVFGGISRIKDQFFLPAGGLSPEEILLSRRARETDFRFNLSGGFSYRFGSKFANVVNPRLGGGGGGRFFF